jgi:cytoskeletal protein RodZ
MAVEAGGIGARLRAGREKLGLTVLQVAERIHTDPKIVEAIEAENFEALGAPVYARGHIRHYADLVGESANELTQIYSNLNRVAQPDLTRIVKAPPAPEASKLVAPALVVIVVFAVAGAIWWVSALSKKKPQLSETHVVTDEVPAASSDSAAGQESAPAADAAGGAPALGATPPGAAAGAGAGSAPVRSGAGGSGSAGQTSLGTTAQPRPAAAGAGGGSASGRSSAGGSGSAGQTSLGATAQPRPAAAGAGAGSASGRSGAGGSGSTGAGSAVGRNGAGGSASGPTSAGGSAGSASARGGASGAGALATGSGAGARAASVAQTAAAPTRMASGVAAAPSPAAAAEPAAAARPKNQSSVTLRYSADSWTEVYDSSGTRLFYDVGAANSVQTVVGTPPLRVVLGNASGVSVEYNGHSRPIAKLSRPDGSVQFSISRSGEVVRAKPVADGG